MKLRLPLIKMATLLFLCGCINAQENVIGMKNTTGKLMGYLEKCDSNGISSIFDDAENLEYKTDEIKADCKAFALIVKKYGIPSRDKMTMSKGLSGENVVSLQLISKADSSLNLSNASLLVFFYPDKYLNNTNKILNYAFIRTQLKEQEKKFIIAPKLPHQ
ncbi:MAG TPA: hypothetical protein VF144_11410 [Chitinophagaceae bacterium]